MKIGVISDTHIAAAADGLPRELLERFREVDLILHAGDILELSVLEKLGELAEVRAVYGNMDPGMTRAELPADMMFSIDNVRIGITHGSGAPGGMEKRVLAKFEKPIDVVVVGHSHQALCRRIGGVLALNPGSPTDTRFAKYRSYGILDVLDGEARGEIVRVDDIGR